MPNYIFPKVELPKVQRSNFSLDKSLMMSFAPSTIRVPWCKEVLPNDSFTIDLSVGLESMPMLAPMYGKWKARWSFYFEPLSNIYGFMDNNNRRSTEEIIKSRLFTYVLPLGYVKDVYSENNEYNTLTNRPSKLFVGGDSARYPLERWVLRAKVASSSIFTDFGIPQGWSGYPESTFSSSPSFVAGTDSQPGIPLVSSVTGDNLTSNYSNLINSFIPEVESPIYYKNQPLHIAKALGYLDIVRNYYANQQSAAIPYIGYTDGAEDLTNRVDYVALDVLDYILMFFRTLDPNEWTDDATLSDYFVNSSSLHNKEDLHDAAITFLLSWERSYFIPNGGCFLSPYSMDLNRGLMNADQGNFKSFVTASNNRIEVSQIYMADKLQQLINVIDITGGRFSHWLNALWAVDIKGNIDKPMYLGSHTQYIATTDIVSPSTTAGSTAGQQTGFAAGGFSANMKNGFKTIHFNSDLYGIVYCVFNLVPVVHYSQGFNREDLKTVFTDIYNPRMSQIGYQDIPAKVLNALPDSFSTSFTESPIKYYNGLAIGVENPSLRYYAWVRNQYDDDGKTTPYLRVDDIWLVGHNPDLVVGRQVAWSEYMSDVDESRGLFAYNSSLSYWVLNRSYKDVYKVYEGKSSLNPLTEQNFVFQEFDKSISKSDYTTYVHPAEWNTLFADSSPDAENFRAYHKFDVFAKRALPKRNFPRI